MKELPNSPPPFLRHLAEDTFNVQHSTRSYLGAGRIGAEIIAVIPIVFRPDRSGTKAAAAIGADVIEDVFDARTAERAFEGADHRLG